MLYLTKCFGFDVAEYLVRVKAYHFWYSWMVKYVYLTGTKFLPLYTVSIAYCK